MRPNLFVIVMNFQPQHVCWDSGTRFCDLERVLMRCTAVILGLLQVSQRIWIFENEEP